METRLRSRSREIDGPPVELSGPALRRWLVEELDNLVQIK